MSAAEAFGQYLELCRARRERSSSRGEAVRMLNDEAFRALPAAIEAYRGKSLDCLASCRPDVLFAPDYGVNIDALAMYADVAASFRCGIPQLQSNLVVVANDCIHIPEHLAGGTDGIEVYRLSEIPASLTDEVADVLSRTADSRNVAMLLNGLLLNDGIYVRITGTPERPLQIVNIFRSDMPMLTARRIIVHGLSGCHGQVLLCDHSQSPEVNHLNSQVADIVLERDAHLELYDIEESSASTHRVFNCNTVQEEASSFNVNTNFLSGGTSSNTWHIDTVGPRTETHLAGLAIASQDQTVDNRVILRHSSTYALSRQLFKYALYDNARGGFGGRIIVEEGAEYTDAAQTDRNIIVGDTAHMEASPQLEIYCDEVKCSHGATTGQLDERALFYMQTRGIPLDTARRMLTQAFMADVVEQVRCEVLRQRLHVLVEKRLSGAPGSCEKCAGACHGQTSNE